MVDGRLDAFDFVLAEKLGMTVAELGQRMSNDEFTRWQAFYTYRHALEEKAAKRSKRGL